MDTAERLLQFIGFKGFGEGRKGKSMLAFYNEVGLSNGSIKAKRSIGSEILSKIFSKYPDLNMDWVITGRGEMLYKSDATMLVGADIEPAKIAIDALKQQNGNLKDEVTELHRKLVKCMEEKEKIIDDGFKKLTRSEPAQEKTK